MFKTLVDDGDDSDSSSSDDDDDDLGENPAKDGGGSRHAESTSSRHAESTSPGAPKFAMSPQVRRKSSKGVPDLSGYDKDPKIETKRRSSLTKGASKSTRDTQVLKKKKDAQGRKQLNQYTLIKTLGIGSYGDVKLCQDNDTDIFYAIKILNKRLNKMEQNTSIDHEIAVMKKIHHPHCTHLYEVIDDPKVQKIYLVLEYVERGPVMPDSMVNDPFPQDTAWKYFRDVIQGLDYLHINNVCHRDIKPSNLLIAQDGTIKIADFGLSQVFSGDKSKAVAAGGSPVFMAPELWEDDVDWSDLSIGFAADIWALGITLYMFVYGSVPFMAKNQIELHEKIVGTEPEFPNTPVLAPTAIKPNSKRRKSSVQSSARRNSSKQLPGLLPPTQPSTIPPHPDFVALCKRLLDKNPKTRIQYPESQI